MDERGAVVHYNQWQVDGVQLLDDETGGAADRVMVSMDVRTVYCVYRRALLCVYTVICRCVHAETVLFSWRRVRHVG